MLKQNSCDTCDKVISIITQFYVLPRHPSRAQKLILSTQKVAPAHAMNS